MKVLSDSIIDITVAANLLNRGRIVAFPTETVFGVGCVFDNKEAYNSLNKLKRRNPDKPYTLMLGNVEDISKYAALDEKAELFVKKIFPGQVTLILPAKEGLPSYVSKDGTIGIRIPDYPLTLSLLKQTKPLLAPSLNRNNEPPMNDIEEIKKEFNGEIEAVINAKAGNNKPSTVISICGTIKIIREGNIPGKDLIEVYNNL